MPEQPTLRDMVRAAADRGLTYRELAERAVDPVTGLTVSKDTINKLVRGRLERMPVDYHLRGLAVALNVPYERVLEAAVAQWYTPEGTAPSASLDDGSVAQELRALRDKADELLSRVEGSDTGSETA